MHFATLYIVLTVFQKPFAVAQGCGAVLARTSNFILNNFLTYRDQRLKGFAILRGLLLFLSGPRRRSRRQCRRGVFGLRAGADLVARRRADGRGVELRDVRAVRVAQVKAKLVLSE